MLGVICGVRPEPKLVVPVPATAPTYCGVILIADKYSRFAPFYDLLSAEFPVYRAGRLLGICALELEPGHQVLDLAVVPRIVV